MAIGNEDSLGYARTYPSDPLFSRPVAYVQCTKEHLLEIFKQVKSYDQTQTQFEQEKTKRITALSEAFRETQNPQILERLNETFNEHYKPHEQTI